MTLTEIFPTYHAGLKIPDYIVDSHRKTWSQIAFAGEFWSDIDRVEIAKQARSARAQRNELPFNRVHNESHLSRQVLSATHKIAADAGKIDRGWAVECVGSMGAGHYVELVAIVASVAAIDAFYEAIGAKNPPLPLPAGGTCSEKTETSVSDIGGYIPMVDPWSGPNVSRALSLVPAANRLFMTNVSSMYRGSAGGFEDMVWQGPLSRPQAELLAARVSSINECFY